MRVIVVEGTQKECEEMMQKLQIQNEMQPKQEKEQFEKKESVTKESVKVKGGYTAKRWTSEQEKKLRTFFSDSQNRFVDGRVKKFCLAKFARSINRTPTAVRVRANLLKIPKTPKKSTQKQTQKTKAGSPEWKAKISKAMKKLHAERKKEKEKEAKPKLTRSEKISKVKERYMQKKHAKVPTDFDTQRIHAVEGAKSQKKIRFPILKTPKISTNELKELFEGIMKSKSTLTRNFSPVLGLTTEKEFRDFLGEVAPKLYDIAAYFGMPNKFVIKSTSDEMFLRYG